MGTIVSEDNYTTTLLLLEGSKQTFKGDIFIVIFITF